tara:strand:+ start:541 stop:699 length:159 start_codon:yes stop_codon:yes gene_type:complete
MSKPTTYTTPDKGITGFWKELVNLYPTMTDKDKAFMRQQADKLAYSAEDAES